MPYTSAQDPSVTSETHSANVKRRSWRRALRSWRLWTALGLMLALVAGYVWATGRHIAVQERDERIAQLIEATAALSSKLDRVTAERDEIRANQSEVESAAQQREDAAIQREETLDQREARLKKRERAVKRREKAVSQQERIQARNTITEGTWAVGVDVQPGTYRTREPVSGDCYWMITSDANGDDIVANDIVTGGRLTVTLSGGQYFTSERCGDWIKV